MRASERWRDLWPQAAVALCAVLPAAPRLFSGDFCLDDAYIHLSYAKSLHLGDGLSYNPGDLETGMSSLLWVITLALIPATSPPVWAVKLVGLACHVGTALASMGLARRLAPAEHARTAALLAGLAVASVPLLVQASISGMGVCLAAWLLVATTSATLDATEEGAENMPAAKRAAVLAGLAYLARPECLAYCGLLAGLRFVRTRRVAAWAPALGALVAALVWSGYLLAVSGHPLPNTYYVKGRGLHFESLAYLVIDLLLYQPVATSLTGLVALGLALRRSRARRSAAWDVLLVCVGTLVAVALTRKLHHGTLFFHSRHAMPFMWAPALLAGLGLALSGRTMRALLGVPLVLATAATLVFNDGLVAQQEQGVRRLHVEVAEYVNRTLPPDAVLAVEGAGALRYFTPRSMEIVDLVGLNTGPIAHAPRLAAARLCYVMTRRVTHLAYLGQWHRSISSMLGLEVMRDFVQPAYAQTLPPAPGSVRVARMIAPRPEFARACLKLARSEGWSAKPPTPPR